jgi:hypothetical protein
MTPPAPPARTPFLGRALLGLFALGGAYEAWTQGRALLATGDPGVLPWIAGGALLAFLCGRALWHARLEDRGQA